MDPAPAPETSSDALLVALAADAQLDRETRTRIGKQLVLAECVARESQDGWTVFGVTSFSQLCEERLNLPAAAGWQLRAATLACQRSRDVEMRVEDGRLNLAKAAAISQVLDYVQETGGEPALLELAMRSTTRETRVEVSRIKEEARIKQRPVMVTLHLTRRAISDLWRARDLLTDGRGGPRPTESFAVAKALESFVDRRCPERKAARAAERDRRRSERVAAAAAASEAPDPAAQALASAHARAAADPTAPAPEVDDVGNCDVQCGREGSHEAPSSRYIPARERDAVVSRHGDVCWMECCDERGALQFAHREPFRFGGANVASNLARWCLHHHCEFDSGRLKLRQGGDGVIVVDRRGQIVGRVRPPPPT